MLKEIFEKLDRWLAAQQDSARRDGFLPLKNCEFRILGQVALLEAPLSLQLVATADLDAYTNASYAVKVELNRLLQHIGMELDPLSDQIWMPKETEYSELYFGKTVIVWRADPIHVLVSKAVKAPEKNKSLLAEYIAGNPNPEFFRLCESYGTDLTEIF